MQRFCNVGATLLVSVICDKSSRLLAAAPTKMRLFLVLSARACQIVAHTRSDIFSINSQITCRLYKNYYVSNVY